MTPVWPKLAFNVELLLVCHLKSDAPNGILRHQLDGVLRRLGAHKSAQLPRHSNPVMQLLGISKVVAASSATY